MSKAALMQWLRETRDFHKGMTRFFLPADKMQLNWHPDGTGKPAKIEDTESGEVVTKAYYDKQMETTL